MGTGSTLATAALALGCVMTHAGAQELQQRLGDLEVGEHWIYDDWNAARQLAAKSQKPLFVVFRCVP